MSKEYPVEIYPKPNERIKDSAERIYDLGFRDGRFKERLEASNPLAGWSNLTEAIKAGERIDWEKLDGLEAKCVHPQLGTLTHKLVRDQPEPPKSWVGWGDTDSAISHWDTVFECAWQGSSGWALYIKGDLPLRKLTADQLEPGTCFSGSHPEVCEGEAVLCVVIGQVNGLPRRVLYPGPTISRLASEVEVVEVYGVGTFQTPKENQ